MAETDPALALPPEAVVFLFHQGYAFMYLLGSGGFDNPSMQWMETEREPQQAAATFAEMVDAEFGLMESNNRSFRETGGYLPDTSPRRRFHAVTPGPRQRRTAVGSDSSGQSVVGVLNGLA